MGFSWLLFISGLKSGNFKKLFPKCFSWLLFISGLKLKQLH